ncbi:MAG: lysine 2,3-aminomutase [Saprospirales bacterium]|nr:lysine 2,3-aminomutase [Saprospirales bacterium]
MNNLLPHKYKAYSLHNFRSIEYMNRLSEQELFDIEVVGNVFPFKVSNYVLDELINWDNYQDDPIFRLTFPHRDMLVEEHYNLMAETLKNGAGKLEVRTVANQIRTELNPHPAGQMKLNVPVFNGQRLTGVQHKYRETVLFFPSSGQTCHSYCTFCFRWPQFTGIDELKFAMKETDLLVKYLQQHHEVTDLLFTGGDPMIMKARVFRKYLEPFLDGTHNTNIQTIRIGSKSLAYWPYKFTTDADADEMLGIFRELVDKGFNVSFMAHFSHPVELSTEAVQKAVERILATGTQIRTQSPVLRHINDNANLWSKMWRQQVNMNMIPYYMFVERDTGAQHYFEIPLEETWEIFRQAYRKVSGICRTVRGPSMSCTPGKVEVLGVQKIAGQKVFVLRFIQGRNPNWVGRPFFAKYDPEATWFNDLEPAFEKHFFFQHEMDKETEEAIESNNKYLFN